MTDTFRGHSYVLSYFTADDEALHLAGSVDGRIFEAIGDGGPVLRGTVGSRTLRDPFIGRSPDGVFHLVATDGWSSTSIVHASSPDLVNWSEQTLLPVMRDVEDARNAWAPEFFEDPATGVVHLIWSSILDTDDTPDDWENTAQNQRIWTATTDFERVGPASVFYDPGYSVIDATVARDGASLLLAFKDERGANVLDTPHKNIRIARFSGAGQPFSAPTEPISPAPVEGPSLFRRGDEWVLIFDHFLESRYGAVASRDGVSWAPTEIVLPRGVRHASVLSLD